MIVQNPAARRTATATGTPSPSAPASPAPAASAAQLVAYATRAAAAAPAIDPKPTEWIYFKALAATSSGGEGGLLFGPPDGRSSRPGPGSMVGNLPTLQKGELVIAAGGGELGGWPNSSYPYLNSLPSSPAKLKAIIEAGLKAENYVIGSGSWRS